MFKNKKTMLTQKKEDYRICMGDSFIGNIKRNVKQHLELDHHQPSCGFTLVSPLSTSRSCSFQCTSVCNITTLYMSIKRCNITTLYMSTKTCNITTLYMSTKTCNITTLYMNTKICNITTLYMSIKDCHSDKLYMSIRDHKPLRMRRCACVEP